jgi:hypothetical protein
MRKYIYLPGNGLSSQALFFPPVSLYTPACTDDHVVNEPPAVGAGLAATVAAPCQTHGRTTKKQYVLSSVIRVFSARLSTRMNR